MIAVAGLNLSVLPSRQNIAIFTDLQQRFVWHMGLGTKNRLKQTADICKRHLREKYQEQLGLVEEFIAEFEGTSKNCDVTRWGQFTDVKDVKKDMLKRLEVHFENWLNR